MLLSYAFLITGMRRTMILYPDIGRISTALTTLFLSSAFLVAVPFIAATTEERNGFMLSEIQGKSKTEDYRNVVVVTGKAHVQGFSKLCDLQQISHHCYRVPSLTEKISSAVKKVI